MSEKKLSDKLDGRPVVRWTAHNEPMFAVTRTEIAALEAKLEAMKQTVDEQAEDEELWFVAETAPEAYLQQELRRLHLVSETMWPPSKPSGTNY